MDQSKFKTPVSFHIFNRPYLSRRTFEVIQSIKPKVLFVTADGPRTDFLDDPEKCRITRNIIEKSINWKCDLYLNYSEINKGSYRCTSDGISWVFENVGEAIILEDDCLPDRSFFYFCSELLDRFRHDDRIALISGSNFLPKIKNFRSSYFFSRYALIWGWATWKRTWENANLRMDGWPEFRKQGGLQNFFYSKKSLLYWDNIFNSMYTGISKPHWDYILFLSLLMNNTLSIQPSRNLISNIGADTEGTNNRKPMIRCNNLPTHEMFFPLKHPAFTSRLYWADERTELMFYSGHYERLRYKVAPYFPPKIRSIIGRIIYHGEKVLHKKHSAFKNR